MSLPRKGEVRGVPVNVSLSPEILLALDEARGKLNRQQWIRETITERLKVEGFYSTRVVQP